MKSINPEQDKSSFAAGLDVVMDDDTQMASTGAYMFSPEYCRLQTSFVTR